MSVLLDKMLKILQANCIFIKKRFYLKVRIIPFK